MNMGANSPCNVSMTQEQFDTLQKEIRQQRTALDAAVAESAELFKDRERLFEMNERLRAALGNAMALVDAWTAANTHLENRLILKNAEFARLTAAHELLLKTIAQHADAGTQKPVCRRCTGLGEVHSPTLQIKVPCPECHGDAGEGK